MTAADEPDGEWFSYDPSGADDHLTPEQHELVRQRRREAKPEPVGDVRVLIHDFSPGQVEVRYGGPPDRSPVELLRFAIAELTTVLAMHER